jgi:hypothetical protein
MKLSYYGFNVRQMGDTVVFGSAPGTGASLVLRELPDLADYARLSLALSVEGAAEGDLLSVTLTAGDLQRSLALPIQAGMHSYELAPEGGFGGVSMIRIAPSTAECVVSVKRAVFSK